MHTITQGNEKSLDMLNDTTYTHELLLKILLLLIGIVLNASEFFIPRIPILPWLKPGLANAVTIVWLVKYGPIEAILVSLLRIWIVSFYFGFSFITSVLALSGALFSCVSMAIAWKLLGRRAWLGCCGLSIVGAVSHNLGQLFAVYWLLATNKHVFYQLPLMLAASLVSGSLVGIVSHACYTAITHLRFTDHAPIPQIQAITITWYNKGMNLCFLGLCIGIVFVNDIRILLLIAACVGCFVFVSNQFQINQLVQPFVRYWLLFVGVALMYSLFTYGKAFQGLVWVSHEGILSACAQCIKIWIWLETAVIFLHNHFHLLLMRQAQKLFPRYEQTLLAGLVAAELFPAIVGMLQSKTVFLLRDSILQPQKAIETVITILLQHLKVRLLD